MQGKYFCSPEVQRVFNAAERLRSAAHLYGGFGVDCSGKDEALDRLKYAQEVLEHACESLDALLCPVKPQRICEVIRGIANTSRANRGDG